MGVAHFSPEDDRHLYSKRYLEAQIVKGLGGRVLKRSSSAPTRSPVAPRAILVHVNRVARRMVYRLGMSSDNNLLVHDEQGAPLSGESQARMDAEVNSMLQKSTFRLARSCNSTSPRWKRLLPLYWSARRSTALKLWRF
jgi:cell division protease FtsH